VRKLDFCCKDGDPRGTDRVCAPHTHRSLNLGPPEPSPPRLRALPLPTAAIERRDRLGGLIHEYNLAA
jgi:hypothetical protein